MKKSMVCTVGFLAVGVFACLTASAFSPNDGLIYDLKLVPTATGGSVTTADLYNGLTHSAAAHATVASVPAFSGDTAKGTPEAISVATVQKSLPVYDAKIPPQDEMVLTLPQSNVEAGGTLYTYKQVVKVSDVQLSSNMTVFCRLYPDASLWDDAQEEKANYTLNIADFQRQYCNDTGSNDSWGFNLNLYHGSTGGTAYPYINFGYYQSVGGPGLVKACREKGIDLALVFETKPGEQTTVTFYVGQGGTVASERHTVNIKGGKQVLKFRSNDFAIGGMWADVGKTDWVALANNKKTKRDTYRGGISRFKIFNRPLSAGEIHGLMTAANGGATVIGTANGSTGEFAAEGEEAAAFNPYTMEPARMRGVLTAEHPSLTIDCPSKGADAGLGKYLAVSPVLDGLAGGSASVDVAVNGVKVDALDLASAAGSRLFIPGKLVNTNGQGCVRYTLTRRGNVTGRLGIDAVLIAGSWQEGFPREGNVADVTKAFDPAKDNLPETFVGHPAATNYLMSVLMGMQANGKSGGKHATSIEFYVPEEIALKQDSRYRFSCRLDYFYKVGEYPSVDTYLNGVKYGETVPSVATGGDVTREFPAGTLLPGFNTITISNATPAAVSIALKDNPQMFPAAHRFTFDAPKKGLLLIFR